MEPKFAVPQLVEEVPHQAVPISPQQVTSIPSQPSSIPQQPFFLQDPFPSQPSFPQSSSFPQSPFPQQPQSSFPQQPQSLFSQQSQLPSQASSTETYHYEYSLGSSSMPLKFEIPQSSAAPTLQALKPADLMTKTEYYLC